MFARDGNFSSQQPPPLPNNVLQVWPPLILGMLGFLLATIASYTITAFQSYRPIAIGGILVGIYGIGIFRWQWAASHRGAMTAQTGLTQLH